MNGTTAARWVKLAGVGELREGTPLVKSVSGRDIALLAIGPVVHAFDNVCPHRRFSALHNGALEDYTVTCPMHGWSFDIRTGESKSGEGRISVFDVSVRGDDVCINMADLQ